MKYIKLILVLLQLRVFALREYICDYFNHIKFCTRYHRFQNYSKDMYRCKIMLLNHQLEKAQTYSSPKKEYGKDKVIELLKILDIYIQRFGYDSVVYTSIGVLQSHMDNAYSYKNTELTSSFMKIVANVSDSNQLREERGGTIVRNLSRISKIEGLYEFMDSRRSCRQYSDQAIDQEEINTAAKYAMTAPSACNRQCVRIHYYDSPELIKNIIYAQKSDINWCLNAKGLIIITANMSSFRDYFERNQRLFDAGLFSMNLVHGLHNQGIGSCFKMAQKSLSIDKKTKEIAKIPYNEDICVLLLVGKYPDKDIVLAKSSRLDVQEIMTIHS